jgi:hypothetical protein
MDVRHDRIAASGADATVNLLIHIPVESELVPDETLAVLLRLGQDAAPYTIAEALDPQAKVGGSRLLRISARRRSIPPKPFQGLGLRHVSWHDPSDTLDVMG